MAATSAEIVSFKNSIKGMSSELSLCATAYAYTGSSVASVTLADYAAVETAYTLLLWGQGSALCATGCGFLYSLDAAGTASTSYTLGSADVNSLITVAWATTITNNDSIMLQVFNDYQNAFGMAETELTNWVATTADDYSYWRHRRTLRAIYETVSNNYLTMSYDMESSIGASLSFSQRIKALQTAIEEMDKDFNRRQKAQAPESTWVAYDSANAFDETIEGYNPEDE